MGAIPGITARSPANDPGFDALAGRGILPFTATPSTQKGNHIRADVILTQNLQWLVHGRIPFVNESTDALLSRYHPL